MMRQIAAAAVIALLALALGACAGGNGDDTDGTEGNGTTDGAGSSRLAAGLYDMEDGTVQAVGTLTYKDLEGGFWAIVGGTGAEGNADTIIAVINDSDEFLDQIESLEGKTVIATGTRFDGATIRMAGPEIVIDSIEEVSDTGGVAE